MEQFLGIPLTEWFGIYKGLRMPLLGAVLIFITWYVYRPSRKADMEQARYDMLDDDVDGELSQKFQPPRQRTVEGEAI